jgi:hypothetical protein
MMLLLVDLSGKTVRSERLGRVTAGQEIQVNVNDITPGIYQIILAADGYKSVSKLVVSGK